MDTLYLNKHQMPINWLNHLKRMRNLKKSKNFSTLMLKQLVVNSSNISSHNNHNKEDNVVIIIDNHHKEEWIQWSQLVSQIECHILHNLCKIIVCQVHQEDMVVVCNQDQIFLPLFYLLLNHKQLLKCHSISDKIS